MGKNGEKRFLLLVWSFYDYSVLVDAFADVWTGELLWVWRVASLQTIVDVCGVRYGKVLERATEAVIYTCCMVESWSCYWLFWWLRFRLCGFELCGFWLLRW